VAGSGLNGCGPAEPSYLKKKRTKGHRETSISGDTRADWSEAFALVPSLEAGYVWHASRFTREVLDGLLRIGFMYHFMMAAITIYVLSDDLSFFPRGQPRPPVSDARGK